MICEPDFFETNHLPFLGIGTQLLKPVILLFLRPLNYGTGYVVLDREHKN